MPEQSYHPIIYVRGFAATQGEIEDTVADPYMGFNIGSTKSRRAWTGEMHRYYFESPLIRLMSDHDYDDVYVEGDDLIAAKHMDHPVPYSCIVIYRYYDEASEDFGAGETPPIEQFARGLDDLILRLREKVCANPANEVTEANFRVHLVAHSMGGLVCRAFLQNPDLGSSDARAAVDRVFTYATPHNGIDMRIVRNVPGWLSFGDVNNFNRRRMAEYLALPSHTDVSEVRGFPADRVFNLVGTNPRDYAVLRGASAWAAGDASDGLVRIENATTHGTDKAGRKVTSPAAYIHRSHSGHYGIVNSEAGYQNLVRFLFGDVRVDGWLDLDEITLPVEVDRLRQRGRKVRGSYQFETALSVRGTQWQLTRREAREHSAIFRTFDQLFPEDAQGNRAPDRTMSPHLFSVFLDSSLSLKRSRSVSFGLDLKVLVPDYEVNDILFLRRHFEGGFLYRELLLVEATPDSDTRGGWRIRYGYQDTNPGKPGVVAETEALDGDAVNSHTGLVFHIPVAQTARPGLTGRVRIEIRPWS